MTFVTASLAVAGLLAMAIPILIHLLWRQRRRPIRWAAMQFLLEAYRKHRRRLHLEQLLLLAARCLILALLGFALARPVLKAAGIDLGGARTVYLVIDNGLAASVVHGDGRTALEQQLEHARQVVDALAPGDFVGVITAAMPARPIVLPASSDLGAIDGILDEIRVTDAATDVGSALRLLDDVLADAGEDAERTFVYLLSEFREGSAPIGRALPDVLERADGVNLLATLPDPEPIANVQIVGVEPVRSVMLPDTADGSGQVKVRLERSGAQLGEQTTTVRISGEDVSRVEPAVVRWQPGESQTDVDFALDVAARGNRELALTVSIDHDGMAGDDTRFCVLQSRDSIRVLLIDRRSFGFQPSVHQLSAGQWIRRALEPAEGSPIEVVDVDPVALDVSDLRTADVAVCPRPDLLPDSGWSLLRGFVDGGGLLMLSPPGGAQVHRWTGAVTEQLGLPWRIVTEVIEHEPPLLADEEASPGPLLRMISGELPQLLRPIKVMRTLPLEEVASQGSRSLRLSDGTTLLMTASPEGGASRSRGIVVYLATAFDLEWSNLTSKPLMVPLLHESIRQGLSLIRSASSSVAGAGGVLDLPSATARLLDPEGRIVPTDGQGRPQEPLDRAGLWTLQDAAGLELGTLAVNVEPSAARTAPQVESAVAAWLGETGVWRFESPDVVGETLASTDAGSPIAHVLLLALIALVVVETLMARFFSHAFRAEPVQRDASDRLAVGGVR